MPIILNAVEARILGSLVEKSLTTPDQYPLSLNALCNACNQKSSRDPVMKLSETDVARGLAELQQKGLVGQRSETGSRAVKFMHHIEQLVEGAPPKVVGALCVLFLRGPQTAGEIKTRTDRLCDFTDSAEVEALLLELAGRQPPLVERLARQSGQKEARYRHLFSAAPPSTRTVTPSVPDKVNDVAERLAQLEKRLAVLEAEVQKLRT